MIKVKKLLGQYTIYFVLILMIIVIAFINPKFFSVTVFTDILTQSSTRILMALGCLFIVLSGGADLSGGRMVGLAAVVVASMLQIPEYANRFFPNLPVLPVIVPIIITLVVCGIFGAANGLIVSYLKVPSFLETLGMSMILYGLCSVYFNKKPNYSQPLGGIRKDFIQIGSGSILHISYLLIIAVVMAIIVHIILKYTRFGKNIYAIGGNQEAAMVSGINTKKVTVACYVIAAVLYSAAGILEAARTGSATNNYGNGYELDAIASCVIGGCSISGGVGTVPGAVIGVIIFIVMSYGLTFIGVSSYWQNVVKGLIIIIAIAFDVRKYIKNR